MTGSVAASTRGLALLLAAVLAAVLAAGWAGAGVSQESTEPPRPKPPEEDILPPEPAPPEEPPAPPGESPEAPEGDGDPEARQHRDAQAMTARDLRTVGTALYSWLTDQTSGGAAPPEDEPGSGPTGSPTPIADSPRTVSVEDYPPISHEALVELLVPRYLETVPAADGWGNPYEFYLAVDDLLGDRVALIRSPGSDAAYEGPIYTYGSIADGAFSEDIVWADGAFVRWPVVERERAR